MVRFWAFVHFLADALSKETPLLEGGLQSSAPR